MRDRRRGFLVAGAGLVLSALQLLAACAPTSQPAPVVTAPPPPREFTVERGQTLSGIARAHHVPMLLLAEANHLGPPYRIFAGQTLIIPGSELPGPAATTVAMAAPGSPAALPAAAPGEVAPIGGPASASSVAARPLAPPAATPAPPDAPVGTAALPPPPAVGAPVPLTPPPALAPAPERRPTPPAAAAPPGEAASLSPPASHSAGPATPPRTEAVASAAAEAPHPERASGFLWPVRGHVVEGFGTGSDGTRNDGINIAAPKGAAIEATDDGVVAYAGNELRGYGNLILVKHANGWISAYAHCDVILVKTGQKVGRGQVIGRVGATGNVETPQLHFELRRGKKPVDPRQYLATSPGEAGKPVHSG